METDVKTIWKIDPSHTEIQFKVKHLVISTVTGSFGSYDATIETQGDAFETARITFTADIDSITTHNDQRDAHLKSDDFFNAETFPRLKFESKSIKKVGDSTYKLTGDLTIRDYTHPITLDVEYGGTVVDPYGQTKAGFELSGKLSRQKFGLKWNGVTEAGGIVVSDEVRLVLNVQVIRN